MVDFATMEASKTKRVLVYGPPKSGKTELVGRLAQEYNLVWFDLESGRDTLFKLPMEYKKRIEMIPIPDTRGYPIAIETCLKVIRGQEVNICLEHGKVQCPQCWDIKEKKPKEGAINTRVALKELGPDTIVVFDSLSQLTSSCEASISRNKPDDYKFQFDDWAKVGSLLDTFLSYVQNASFNVVCISHERDVEMEDGKDKLVPAAGTRNFSRNSAKYFGEVIYCELVNKSHKFASSTTYKNNVLTGSRAGISLEESKNPSLLDIFKG